MSCMLVSTETRALEVPSHFADRVPAPCPHPCMQGVVRVENLEDATEHVPTVLLRVKPEYLVGCYWTFWRADYGQASAVSCPMFFILVACCCYHFRRERVHFRNCYGHMGQLALAFPPCQTKICLPSSAPRRTWLCS